MKKLKIAIRLFKVRWHGHYRLIKLIRRRINRQFIANLQFLQPNYYHDYVTKYGNEDFTWWLTEIGKSDTPKTKFLHFEKGKTVESTEHGEPVTITITKDNHSA